MEPIRILHVITGLGSGGAESLIMNWYRNIDRNLIQFDFLLRSEENIYSKEIENLGGRVFYTPEYPKHYFKNKKETNKFFKEHIGEFKAIHVHGNALLYVNVFKIAKKYGVDYRIMHSHNTKTKRALYSPIHNFNKTRINSLATHFFACSEEAKRFAFKPSVPCEIVKNGIHTNAFCYNPEIREKVRQELNLSNDFVVGHVGRFLKSKNHKFIIEYFETFLKKRSNAVLLLIGDGFYKSEIQELVDQKRLSDKVLFLGNVSNISEMYQAMDLFIFPSLFEGFGIAALEAQCTGLHTLISDTIPKAVALTPLSHILSIDSIEPWVEESLKINSSNRKSFSDKILDSGFDIKKTSNKLQQFYLKL